MSTEEKKSYFKIIIIISIALLFLWDVFLQYRQISLDKKYTKKLKRIENKIKKSNFQIQMRMDDIESEAEDRHTENQMRMDDIEYDVEDRHFENQMRIDDNESRIDDLEMEIND